MYHVRKAFFAWPTPLLPLRALEHWTSFPLPMAVAVQWVSENDCANERNTVSLLSDSCGARQNKPYVCVFFCFAAICFSQQTPHTCTARASIFLSYVCIFMESVSCLLIERTASPPPAHVPATIVPPILSFFLCCGLSKTPLASPRLASPRTDACLSVCLLSVYLLPVDCSLSCLVLS